MQTGDLILERLRFHTELVDEFLLKTILFFDQDDILDKPRKIVVITAVEFFAGHEQSRCWK